MAKLLTTQEDMTRVFDRMERDYGALSKKQQAYAITEIGRVRGELAELLGEFADDEGKISRRRARMVTRELDVIEQSLREHGEIALNNIIEETTEWTVDRVNKGLGITISASSFDRVNENVLKYITKRFGDEGLVVSERIWGLSGGIRDDLSKVIRSGIIRGEGITSMTPKLRKVYDNETWKIRRLARNESVTAHRAAIGYNAQESDVVKWVQFHHGVKNTEECVDLANEDSYGNGKGVFKPTDTDIWKDRKSTRLNSSHVTMSY